MAYSVDAINKYLKLNPIQVSGWGDTVILIDGVPFLHIVGFKPPDKEKSIDTVYSKHSNKPVGYKYNDFPIPTGTIELREEDYVKLNDTYMLINQFTEEETELVGGKLIIVEKIGPENIESFTSLHSMHTLRVWMGVKVTKVTMPQRSQGDIDYIVTLDLLFTQDSITITVPV